MDRFKVPENVRKELINLPAGEKIQRAIGFQMLKLIDLTDEINKTKKESSPKLCFASYQKRLWKRS